MKILVFFKAGGLSRIRTSTYNHIFFLKQHIEDKVEIIYWDIIVPVPQIVKKTKWSAILLDVTVLGLRWSKIIKPSYIFEQLDWIAQSPATKIAFPQDEYTYSSVLDEWLIRFNIDIVYSVCYKHKELLLPRYSKIGIIKQGYTGYINKDSLSGICMAIKDRSIGIGYRAKKLPAKYGWLGYQKWAVAEMVQRETLKRGYHSDISIKPDDVLLGGNWISFLQDSKYTLGTNSGSSLIDFRGELENLERTYLMDHPEASYQQIVESCFNGNDKEYNITAISPRILESALAKSCQILIPGEYGDKVQPWEHYIPLNFDGSNIADVFEVLSDEDYTQRIADRCFDAIVSDTSLYYETHAREILESIRYQPAGLKSFDRKFQFIYLIYKLKRGIAVWLNDLHSRLRSVIVCRIKRSKWIYLIFRLLKRSIQS